MVSETLLKTKDLFWPYTSSVAHTDAADLEACFETLTLRRYLSPKISGIRIITSSAWDWFGGDVEET
jgi:hypothetical protein